MGRRILQFGSFAVLIVGLSPQIASAQNGERLREMRAQQQARRQAAGQQQGQPTERSMEGLPGKWIERLRDMPPEQQQQFLQNNAQFRALPPQRQQQILQNLNRWNRLSPEQKQEARDREAFLEQLTPEQRQYVRNVLLPKWQGLPQPRRQVINRHLAMLGQMSPATQQAALHDPRFMAGLSPDEQSMLRELNSLRNPPPAAPAQ